MVRVGIFFSRKTSFKQFFHSNCKFEVFNVAKFELKHYTMAYGNKPPSGDALSSKQERKSEKIEEVCNMRFEMWF